MAIFNEFPQTNFHDMNLDWILKTVKDLTDTWLSYSENWNRWREDTDAAMEELKDFVTNYFTNLDVQEEINNKIISMINSGEFASIVETYIPPEVTEWLSEHITQPEGVVIDTSLSVSGACADAKATGDRIAKLKSDIDAVSDNLDGEYPNLWDCNYISKTSNGITWTKQADGTFKVTGTATEISYQQQTITLPAGNYSIGGFVGGGPNTYHSIISVSGSILYQADGWKEITLNDETDIIITTRVLSGITIDTIFKPIIMDSKYRSSVVYVQYGVPYFNGKITDKVSELYDITGYVKPNLFDNTIQNYNGYGISLVVNDDKSITISGQPTITFSTFANCTLKKGKYILSGCNGTPSTYVLRLIRGDGSPYIDQYSGIEQAFEVTQETETVQLYVSIANGATVNDTIYPMIRPADVNNPEYVPYGVYQIYKPIQQLIDYTEFNWSGKKLNVLGDSIAAGIYGDFAKVIKAILNLDTVRNYGIGGSRIASTDLDSQYTPACIKYEDMDDDADIIIVHAGTNDYTAQVPIGDADSQDITTFNGALNVLMTGLKTKYPSQLIIFSNILDRIQDKNTSLYPITCQVYRDALEAACARNHMVFYDGLKNTNFDFHKGYYDHVLTVDGLHPNQAGANILGRSIAGFIKWH